MACLSGGLTVKGDKWIFRCLVASGGKLIMDVDDYSSHEGLRNRNRPREDLGWGRSGFLGGEAQPIRDKTLFKPRAEGYKPTSSCQEKGVSDFCSPGCSQFLHWTSFTCFILDDPSCSWRPFRCALCGPPACTSAPFWKVHGRVMQRHSSWWLWSSPIAVASRTWDAGCDSPAPAPWQPTPDGVSTALTPGLQGFFSPGYVSLSYRIKF